MATHLIAATYPGEATANGALAALVELADEHGLELKDAAVVLKRDDGDVELRQTREPSAGDGMVGGGTIGLLLGLVIGVPVAGSLIGMLGGFGLTSIDGGVSDDQMRAFGTELQPGQAALFALVADTDWERLRERLEPYGGVLAASEIDEEVAARLGSGAAPP